VVEGFISGLHRSPFGFSVDFAEYRQYMPGDDISTLDWRVYARTERHYYSKRRPIWTAGCLDERLHVVFLTKQARVLRTWCSPF
jgi:hypothetical protein